MLQIEKVNQIKDLLSRVEGLMGKLSYLRIAHSDAFQAALRTTPKVAIEMCPGGHRGAYMRADVFITNLQETEEESA